MELNKNTRTSQPDYMLAADTAGWVLMRKCGKTVSSVEGRANHVLQIQDIATMQSKYIVACGLEPYDFPKGEKNIGAKAYHIQIDDSGNLGFIRVKKWQVFEGGEIQYFIHSQTKQVIRIHYPRYWERVYLKENIPEVEEEWSW